MKKILFFGLSNLSFGSSLVAESQKTIEPAEVVVATKEKKTFRQKASKLCWQAGIYVVGFSAAILAHLLVNKTKTVINNNPNSG